MNTSNGSKNGVLLLIAIGLIAAPAAHSQVVDTSEWVCEFCPFESGHRAEYSLGASTVSDDSAYFGDASGYSEEGVYANVDGHGTYASDGHRLQWQIEDLGLDSRFAPTNTAASVFHNRHYLPAIGHWCVDTTAWLGPCIADVRIHGTRHKSRAARY